MELYNKTSHSLNLAGTQSEFIINNTKAGPGSLAVTIEGPSKVKMDCQEVPEGYKVQYTPMAPGNYLISIKYGGPNHITGSPFKAKVTGKMLLLVKVGYKSSLIQIWITLKFIQAQILVLKQYKLRDQKLQTSHILFGRGSLTINNHKMLLKAAYCVTSVSSACTTW